DWSSDVCSSDLLWRGCKPRTDSPYRLVRQNHFPDSFCTQREHRLKLAADDLQRIARLALGLRFTNTHHRRNTASNGSDSLARNNFAAFAMIGAALGMSHNNPGTTELRKHSNRHLAGVCAFGMLTGVLSTPADGAILQSLCHLLQIGKRCAYGQLCCRPIGGGGRSGILQFDQIRKQLLV